MEPLPKSVWDRRWAMIRLVLLFCASLVTYIVVWGPDDRLRETAILVLGGLSGTVVLGYLGFATYDDRNWLSFMTERGKQK